MTFQVSHEINSEGLYTLTVSDRKTGEMHFAWIVPVEDALDVADLMKSTAEGWMSERGRHQNQAHTPTPGEVWPDTA